MKLKTVFIIFNVIIVITFVLVFLMPLFFLGIDFTIIFWRSNWYLAVLFLTVLAVLNGYFARNWRLFSALERENWEEISTVLEDRVRRRGQINDSNIRLLVNAYVVSSRTDAIRELESHVRRKKPALLRRHVLRFGIPHLLSNNGDEIQQYFGEFRGKEIPRSIFRSEPPPDAEYWIEWSYAFGLLLQERMEAAGEILTTVVDTAPVGIVHAISLYLLSSRSDEDGRKEEFVRRMPRTAWRKTIERERTQLHVLVLGKLLKDVEQWLYSADEKGNQ